MITIQVVLYSRKNKEGKYPVAIRLIENRKASYIFIGVNIQKEEWDAKNKKIKKAHPNSSRLNAFISKKVNDINNEHLTLELESKEPTVDNIRTNISKSKVKQSFFEEAKIYIDNLKISGKYNRYVAEKPRIEIFKEFNKGKDIKFQDITVSVLKQFSAYIKGERKVSERTVVNYLIVIRSIFNQGIKSGKVNSKYYPFGNDKLRIKFPESVKIGLNIEEVKLIEDFDAKDNEALNNAKNIWLMSFYFAGMRVSDILRLRWTDFQDNRLYYKMGKNEKAGSIIIPQKANTILEQYIESKGTELDLVFPYLMKLGNDLNSNFKTQKRINQVVKIINKNLGKISKDLKLTKKLTMHISRHTFGNISGDLIPIQKLKQLYRHTSITTTIGYQANFINQDTDQALEKVIDF